MPLDDLDDNDTSASDAEYFKTVVWTAVMGTAVDTVLTVVKFAAGFAFASSALTADAVHSASDVVSDLVVIAAARYASVPPDAKYPYGRGRWEAVATLFVSVALAWAASTLAWEFAERLVAAYGGPLGHALGHAAVHPGSAQLPTTRSVLLEIPAAGGGVSSASFLDDLSMTIRKEDATATAAPRSGPPRRHPLARDDGRRSPPSFASAVSVAAKEVAFQRRVESPAHRIGQPRGERVASSLRRRLAFAALLSRRSVGSRIRTGVEVERRAIIVVAIKKGRVGDRQGRALALVDASRSGWERPRDG